MNLKVETGVEFGFNKYLTTLVFQKLINNSVLRATPKK
jgi:hypothetical protein